MLHFQPSEIYSIGTAITSVPVFHAIRGIITRTENRRGRVADHSNASCTKERESPHDCESNDLTSNRVSSIGRKTPRNNERYVRSYHAPRARSNKLKAAKKISRGRWSPFSRARVASAAELRELSFVTACNRFGNKPVKSNCKSLLLILI